MAAHYVNKNDPEGGCYEIFVDAIGAWWHWTETAEGTRYEDQGPRFPTVAAAYRDAADDWENNGNSANKRLSGQLRAAATRTEKEA